MTVRNAGGIAAYVFGLDNLIDNNNICVHKLSGLVSAAPAPHNGDDRCE